MMVTGLDTQSNALERHPCPLGGENGTTSQCVRHSNNKGEWFECAVDGCCDGMGAFGLTWCNGVDDGAAQIIGSSFLLLAAVLLLCADCVMCMSGAFCACSSADSEKDESTDE
eukprot:2043240-Prymnesium_polylepis.1